MVAVVSDARPPKARPTETRYVGPESATPYAGEPVRIAEAMPNSQPFSGTSGYFDVSNQENSQDLSSGSVPFESRFAELERQAAEMNEKLKVLQDGATKAKADASKLPSVQINGVFQADAVLFDQDPGSFDAYGKIENGADFRRARLSAKGSVTDRMDYFLQMDFGFFGRPTFTDVWVDFKQAGPLGTIRVGQWKQPFSLEAVSSFRYTTFMERAGVFQAFVPFRHIGIGFYDNAEDLMSTWAMSYFRTGQDQYGGSISTDGGNGMAGRLTHLLWYNDDCGDRYLHLGLGYYLNAPPFDRRRDRSIPEIFVGEFFPSGPSGTSGQPIGTIANGTPFFVDTGFLEEVNLINTYGTESLWVRGPLSWQSEFMAQHIDTDSVGNALLWGGYSQIGYFLTGEHRPYDRKAGAIDRVIPLHSVSKSGGGIGAWELAVRWSYLDLLDRNVRGGDMDNFTAGVNWYVNPYCKCVFNYIHSNSNSRRIRNGIVEDTPLIHAETSAFGMRCQLDF